MKFHRPFRPTLLPAALIAAGCFGLQRHPRNDAGVTEAMPADPERVEQWSSATDTSARMGVHLRLLDIPPAAPALASAPAARMLSEEQAADVLARLALPAIEAPAPEGFRFATRSLPAPRPGRTTRGVFPGPAAAAALPLADPVGPARPVSMSPQGEIATASQVRVTFSRPMVPLSTVPPTPAGIRLTPEVEGEWHWLDLSTLVFDVVGGLPKATLFTVEVPAGPFATGGAALAEPMRWTFSTTPAAVQAAAALPSRDAAQPIIGIVFDQQVDPDAILPFLRLEIDGVESTLRLVTSLERSAWAVRSQLDQWPEWTVAVRPVRPFAPGDPTAEWKAVLRVLPGAPSAEGPRRTAAEAEHAFTIRKSLRVLSHGCGRAPTCVPGVPWTVRFNHQLPVLPDTARWVEIEPELPGATVEFWNDNLVVLGAPRPETTYTVRLNPAISTYYAGELGPTEPLRFVIGPPRPNIWTPGAGLAVLRDDQPARYTVLAEGVDSVRVEIRAVTPDDWRAYEVEYLQRYTYLRYGLTPELGPLPGDVLDRISVPVYSTGAGGGEAIVDLGESLRRAGGHVLLAVEPAGSAVLQDTSVLGRIHRVRLAWVQRSGIVVDVAEDGEALTVRAASVADGRPAADVPLELWSNASRNRSRPIATAVTDEHGLATLRAGSGARSRQWQLQARYRGLTVLTPRHPPDDFQGSGPWGATPRAHFLKDRPIYSAGDTVRFAGWLRMAGGVGNEPVAIEEGARVAYMARDPRSAQIAQDTLEVGPNGRIEGSFVLPPEANSGTGEVWFYVLQRGGVLMRFEIQDVRRPTFEVGLQLEPGPHSPGSSLDAFLEATYYSGGGLPNAAVRWTVSSRPTAFVPPGADDYRFGRAYWPAARLIEPVSDSARTDSRGEDRLRIAIDSVRPGVPMLLSVQAVVTDVDRQPRQTGGGVVIHPADVYVGLRARARFVRMGEPLIVEAIAVDLDGQPVLDRPVELRALQRESQVDEGVVRVRERVHAVCRARSRTTAVRCRFADLPIGHYIISATTQDARGHEAETEIGVRVVGETISADARARRDSVAVLADRDVYEPGDTAILLIETSFPARDAWLTLRRGGVLQSWTVGLDDGVATVRLPIEDEHVPNIDVHAVVSAADGATASNVAALTVRPTTRTLAVSVTPAAAHVTPGAATTVSVEVRDAHGRPVPGADVVLSGVDEALVALSRKPFEDPLSDLYARSSAGVIDRSLRMHLAPRVVPAAAPQRANADGTVIGVVIDGISGRPIPRAWVEAVGTGIGTWTGPDGSYRLDGLPAGPWLIQSQADGYVTATSRIDAIEVRGFVHSHFLMLTKYAALAGGRSVYDVLARQPEALLGGGQALALSELVVSGARAGDVLAFTVAQLEMPQYAGLPVADRLPEPAALRKNFSPVAAFVAGSQTDANGRVEIAIDVPHNLTRYRLRAVAVAGDRNVGFGESSLTARLPLMVRPVPPRFLYQGDRFELPVLLENRTDQAIEVEVAVRSSNAELVGTHGRTVALPANDRVELRFPVVAGLSGVAHFQVAAAEAGPAEASTQFAMFASSRGSAPNIDTANARRPIASDAAEITVPILLPAPPEAFAMYGELNDAQPISYPMRLPENALPGQSRIEVGFSTTAAHGLRDALFYLLQCAFDLPEVWASRILALSTLKAAPSASPWPVKTIDLVIRSDVIGLARMQLQDGGWSVWTPYFTADPFITVHVAHALERARSAGVDVPERTLTAATAWLERIDEHAPPDTQRTAPNARPPYTRGGPAFPADYPLQAKRAVQAYALYVRNRLGQDVAASAAGLLREAGPTALPAEALAWLLPALGDQPEYAAEAADIRRILSSRLVRSAGTVAIVSPYEAGGRNVFYSPRRTDAVVLEALVNDGSAADLIGPLARGLMAHRVQGYWSNTQENAFAVAALARYLSVAEAIAPDMVARAWGGPRLAAERAFAGRSDERHEITIPADSLGEPGAALDLTLARTGSGRLYYRIGMSYVRAGLTPPIRRGFQVSRTYEAVDDSSDVRRDEHGVWRIRLGARVRVRVAVAAAGPRYHVAVIDPLPAGFEAVNMALAGQGAGYAPSNPRQAAAFYGAFAPSGDREPFYAQHVNVKDDRYEAFTTLMQPGYRELTYLALATTPGDFAAPAPRAEEMYAPETFGRGAGERVVVEDRGR